MRVLVRCLVLAAAVSAATLGGEPSGWELVAAADSTSIVGIGWLQRVPAEGDSPPPVLAPDGGRVPASIMGEKGAVLVFWATWCSHCLAEFPALARIHPRSASCGLPLVGISLDVMPRSDLTRWIQRQAVGWPQVFDGRGYKSPLAQRYQVEVLPYVVIVDAQGHPVASGLRGKALADAVDRCEASSTR